MPRCGCQDQCTCLHRAGRGHRLTGTGATTNAYVHSFDGSSVVGDGLNWDATRERLGVKLAAGGGLAFNSGGGLYVVDPGGGGGLLLPGVTVKELEDRADEQNIVGGMLGAGYMIKPESTIGSVRYGARRGLDAMQLPIRFLRDGTPVVASPETLDGEHIQEIDVERWRALKNLPGVWATTPEGPDDPKLGWFGFLERNELGLPTLADVLEAVNRQCVLVLQLVFPAITGSGSSAAWTHTTPDERVAAFLSKTITLLRRYRLQNTVIMLTETPLVPQVGGDVTQRDVLGPFLAESVAAGPVLATPAQAAAWPPTAPQWDQWRWVVLGAGLPIDTMQGYTGLPTVHGLIAPVSRQYLHEQLVVPSGAAGVLAADPEYYAGAVASHPHFGGFAYRKPAPTWWYSTVDHGMLPPTEGQDDVSALQRAFLPRQQAPGNCILGQEAQRDGVTYFVLQGYLGPLPNATNYELNWLMDVQTPGGVPANINPVRAEFAFAVATDHALTRWEDATDQTGYIVSYRTQNQDADKRISVWAWNPNTQATTELKSWQVNEFDAGFVGFRVRVNAQRVEFAVTDRTTGAVIPSVPPHVEDSEIGRASRGGYVYLGRGAGAAEAARGVFQLPPGKFYRPDKGDDPASGASERRWW